MTTSQRQKVKKNHKFGDFEYYKFLWKRDIFGISEIKKVEERIMTVDINYKMYTQE